VGVEVHKVTFDLTHTSEGR